MSMDCIYLGVVELENAACFKGVGCGPIKDFEERSLSARFDVPSRFSFSFSFFRMPQLLLLPCQKGAKVPQPLSRSLYSLVLRLASTIQIFHIRDLHAVPGMEAEVREGREKGTGICSRLVGEKRGPRGERRTQLVLTIRHRLSPKRMQ